MHQRLTGVSAAVLACSCGAQVHRVDDDVSSDAVANTVTEAAGEGGIETGANVPRRPCDLLESQGHPCVAAHSTVRVLNSRFEGPLYEVCRGEVVRGFEACRGEKIPVYPHVDGSADVERMESVCTPDTCTITVIHDQAGNENHLTISPPGSSVPSYSSPVPSLALPVLIDGHRAYGLLFKPGTGYRAGCIDCEFPVALGGGKLPVGDEPQTVYMITSQLDSSEGCCFDYGNGSWRSRSSDGSGTTEAIYFGRNTVWSQGAGEGPWVMADLQNGVFAGWEDGSGYNAANTEAAHDFVTAILVGDTADKNGGYGRFALYAGDAQKGELSTMYDGVRPELHGYVPMQKDGSVLLGTAADNGNQGGGRFYEGVIATGAASKRTLDALQSAIVAAQYGK
jgi:non-reducing end alpha-L-arabinofuranosidase